MAQKRVRDRKKTLDKVKMENICVQATFRVHIVKV